MEQAQRGMEAVIAKSERGPKRRMATKRKGEPGKGPGIAIMIAMGKPKPGAGGPPDFKEKSLREELDASKGEGMSKAEKIAALEEKIGYLKAELALLKNDSDEMDEMGGEMDKEMDDEGEYDEDED
jgi:hypothetical protein